MESFHLFISPMQQLRRFSLLVCLLGLPYLASAQTITLTGQVTNSSDRSPVPAVVSVLPSGASKTSTDVQGRFNLELRIGDSLLVEAFGYDSKRLKVTTAQPLTIALTPIKWA